MAGRRALLAATVLAVGAYVVNARSMVCHSVGDTHIRSFDGRRYDAMGSGMWRLAKTKDGFFENQVKQTPWVQMREDVTVDTSMAQRCGPYIFEMNADSGRSPTKLTVNKAAVSIKQGETRNWEAKASKEYPYKTTMTLRMQRVDSRMHMYRLECRAEKSGADPILIFTDVRAYSSHMRGRWWAHTNVVITMQNTPYKDGDFTGLCGMTSDEEDNLVRANNCQRVGFKTDACKAIVLVKDHENLAKDLKVLIKSAKAGLVTLDAARLAQKREHCMGLVAKVVPNLDDVPPTLRKDLVDAAADCAYDTYYGLPSSTKGMKDALCSFGQEQVDIMRYKAAEQYRKMRCLFSPESALAMKGGSDMAKQRQQAEKISQAIACVLSTIEEFTFDGCQLRATEALENASSAKKCGGEGDDEEKEDAPVAVPVEVGAGAPPGGAGAPPDAAGAPPALLQVAGLRGNK